MQNWLGHWSHLHGILKINRNLNADLYWPFIWLVLCCLCWLCNWRKGWVRDRLKEAHVSHPGMSEKSCYPQVSYYLMENKRIQQWFMSKCETYWRETQSALRAWGQKEKTVYREENYYESLSLTLYKFLELAAFSFEQRWAVGVMYPWIYPSSNKRQNSCAYNTGVLAVAMELITPHSILMRQGSESKLWSLLHISGIDSYMWASVFQNLI